jgi:hypothetical protein
MFKYDIFIYFLQETKGCTDVIIEARNALTSSKDEELDKLIKDLINEHMTDMNKKHIPDAQKIIKELILHPDYEKYIDVFVKDKDNQNIKDIEETILSVLKNGEFS